MQAITRGKTMSISNPVSVGEEATGLIGQLIKQAHDWKRCRRRYERMSPQFERRSARLQQTLLRPLDAADRERIQFEMSEADNQLEVLEAGYRDHSFADLCEMCAPLTGFGSGTIAAAALAGFDRSLLPAEFGADLCELIDRLHRIGADQTADHCTQNDYRSGTADVPEDNGFVAHPCDATVCEIVTDLVENVAPSLDAGTGSQDSTAPVRDTETNEDRLPGKLRRLSPSRVEAKALYDWAMSAIPNAEVMTYRELYEAVECHPAIPSNFLPPNPEAFGKYLRDAGVKKNQSRKGKPAMTKRSDL